MFMADFTPQQNIPDGPGLEVSCFSSPTCAQQRHELELNARRLLTTFIETPRSQLEEQKLFGKRLEFLRRAIDQFPELGSQVVAEILEPYVIALAASSKLELLGALHLRVDEVGSLSRYSDKYAAALEYGLSGEVLYGNLARVRDVAETIYPGYFSSEGFLRALIRRTEASLQSFNFPDLREIDQILVAAELEFDARGIKGQLILATREIAEQSFAKNIGSLGHSEFEQMFWLDGLWQDSDSQQALHDAICSALCRDQLLEAAQLSVYPLNPKYRKELKDLVELTLDRERARIAGGSYERLSIFELERLHMRPLAMLEQAFDLHPFKDFRGPRTLKGSAI